MLGIVGRVYVWAHHFFDVLVGAGIGFFQAYIVMKVNEKFNYDFRIYLVLWIFWILKCAQILYKAIQRLRKRNKLKEEKKES